MSKKTSLILNITILALVAICVITLLLSCFSVRVSSLDEELWNKSAYTSAVKEPQKVRFGVGFLVNTVFNFGDVVKCLDIRKEGAPLPSLSDTKEMWEKLEDNKGFANAVMGVFVIFNALANGAVAWIGFLLIAVLCCLFAAIILLVYLIKSVIFLVKEKEGVTVKRMSGKFEAAPLLLIWLVASVPILNCIRLLNPKYYGDLDASVSVWIVLCFVSAFAICSVRVVAEIMSTDDSVARGELITKQALSLASAVFSTLCLIMVLPLTKQASYINAVICWVNLFIVCTCTENVIARYGMFVKSKDYTERKASQVGGVLLVIINLVGCILNGFSVFNIIGLIGAIVFVVLEFYYHSKYDTVKK